MPRRARLAMALLLLALPLSGCLAARADAGDDAASPHAEGDAAEPAADGSGADPERLRVSWFPERPKPGDLFRVEIETAVRWPEPRCDVNQLAWDVRGGGEGSSHPATLVDGVYVCETRVAAGVGALTLTVTRPHDGLVRVHGPHVVEVLAPDLPLRSEFKNFRWNASPEGSPHASARVPLPLASVAQPALGPLPAWNSTHAYLLLQAWPADQRLHLGHWAPAQWLDPLTFGGDVDVGQRIREAGADMGEAFNDRDFVALAIAFAVNERAFAVAAAPPVGFGACAATACFVQDA